MTGLDIRFREYGSDLDRLLANYRVPVPEAPLPAPYSEEQKSVPLVGIASLTESVRANIPGAGLAMLIAEVTRNSATDPVPGYDVYKDPVYRPYIDREPTAFLSVRSPGHAELVAKRLDSIAQHRRDFETSPIAGIIVDGAMSMLDPLLFAGKAAGFAHGVATGFGRGMVSEALLRAGDVSRPIEEGVFGVASFALINGITGGAFARAYKDNVKAAEADAAQYMSAGRNVDVSKYYARMADELKDLSSPNMRDIATREEFIGFVESLKEKRVVSREIGDLVALGEKEITARTADDLTAVAKALPDEAFHNLRVMYLRAREGEEVSGLQVRLKDDGGFSKDVIVFSHLAEKLEALGSKKDAAGIFAHEIGHKIMLSHMKEADLAEARRIYDQLGRPDLGWGIPQNEWFAEGVRIAAAKVANRVEARVGHAEPLGRHIAEIDEFIASERAFLASKPGDLKDRFFTHIGIAIAEVYRTVYKIRQMLAYRTLSPKEASRRLNEAEDYFDNLLSGKERLVRDNLSAGEASIVQSMIARPPTGSDLGLKPAFGLEKLPDTPVRRLLALPEAIGQRTTTELVDLGGMSQRQNVAGIATPSPVEREMITRYRTELVDGLREEQRAYLAYREKMAVDTPSDASINWKMMKLGASDLVQGRGGALSWAEFREEIGKALHSGDDHLIPEVAAGARAIRRVLDHVKQLGMNEKVFSIELRRSADQLKTRLLQTPPGTARNATESMVKELEARIERVDKFGPDKPVNAQTFFPLIFRQDRIDADIVGFKQMLRENFGKSSIPDEDFQKVLKRYGSGEDSTKNRAIALREAREEYVEKMVDETYKTIRSTDPYKRLHPDAAGIAKSLKERELAIPVEKLMPYLELDADAVTREYVRAMSADIELTRKFGAPDMAERLGEIEAAWQAKITAAGNDNATIKSLEKNRDAALSDLRALRDRIRGTYGLPDEPHSLTAATFRTLKSFNYVTMLGGVVLSSLPDPMRVWMTEGFGRAFGHGLGSLWADPAIFKMASNETRLAGEALDAVLGSRAAAFLDTGSVLGKQFKLERALNVASEQFSYLNLIHAWTDTMKLWSGAVTGSRIIETSRKLSSGTASQAEIEKLAKAGIDKNTATLIAGQFDEFGTKGKKLFVAGSENWTDDAARDAFRSALIADVNRTIVTPGVGDTPLWTSTQFGSVISQFKKFGLASTTRILISGLQEGDAAFWSGAAALVAAGGLAGAIKDKVQYGNNYSDRTLQDQMITAIDRSGITGWFMDVNNSLERLTDNKLGLHSLIGDKVKRPSSFAAKMGVIGGPTGQNVATAINVGTDLATFDYDKWTARNIRRLMPGQSLFWAQPFFDSMEDVMAPGPAAGRQQGRRMPARAEAEGVPAGAF